MVSKAELLRALPPYNNKKLLVTYTQSTNDIIKSLIEVHKLYEKDYDRIYRFFDEANIRDTCRGLWEFCKYRLNYVIESEDFQTVSSPAAILQPGEGVDCKHYSLFIGGVLDAISRHEMDGWDWFYRFANYNGSKHVEHVFVVVQTPGYDIWVDPVLSSFDVRKKPEFYIDKSVMALYKVSGVNDSPMMVTVDSSEAETGFITMVNLNLMGIGDLMRNNPAITNGVVKRYYVSQGWDWDRLQSTLNNSFVNGH